MTGIIKRLTTGMARCLSASLITVVIGATPALAEGGESLVPDVVQPMQGDQVVMTEPLSQEQDLAMETSAAESPFDASQVTVDNLAASGSEVEPDVATGEAGGADVPASVAQERPDGDVRPAESPMMVQASGSATADAADQILMTVAGETSAPDYDASRLLDDNGVYSFSPSSNKAVLVSNVSGTARLADNASNYLSGYWRVRNLGQGLYTFASLADGRALSFDADAQCQSDVGLGLARSNWRLLKCDDGSLSLAPEGHDSLRLDVCGGRFETGNKLHLYTVNGTAAQYFLFTRQQAMSEAVAAGEAITPGTVSITCLGAVGKSLDIKGGSMANRANVQVYSSNDSLAQRYRLYYKGNGLYTIEVVKSGKYLDVSNGGTTSGSNVQQYQGNASLAQHWYFKKGDAGYVICSAKSGLVLDREHAKTANGTNIRLWLPNGSKAQLFGISVDNPLNESIAAGKVAGDGIYIIRVASDGRMVIDVTSGRVTDGANVQIYTANDSRAQKYELTYLGSGLYTIQASHSGKYLNAAGTERGSNVNQMGNRHSRNQMWYFVKSDSGYAIKSSLSGLCLDLTNGKTTNGTNVQCWTANGTAAQRFTLSVAQLLPNGTYVFSSALAPAQLIEVTGTSRSSGANVQVGRMRRSSAQQWTLTYLGNCTYRIANKNSGHVLDVAGGSTANGANVRQWRSNGTDAQKWVLGVSDDGGITIRSVKSGRFVDLKGGRFSSGTNVQQYSGNGTKAQSFVPYAISSSFVTAGKTGYQNPSRYYQISAYNCTLPSHAKGFFTYVTPSRVSPTATRNQCVEAFVRRAYEFMNTSYVWDWAMAPGQGVDCSGLVMQCLYSVGMQTPYNTYDHMYDPWQDHNAENMRVDSRFKQVPFSDRQRGDLIFYPGHVGIYLGNNQIINAYPPKVQIQSVFSWTVTGCSRVFV